MADHIPTFADICSAIAEGHLKATSDGSMYQISMLELRRYFKKIGSLSPNVVTSQSPSPHTDPGNWSDSVHISVA